MRNVREVTRLTSFEEKRYATKVRFRMLKKSKSDFCDFQITCSLNYPLKTVFDERTATNSDTLKRRAATRMHYSGDSCNFN